MEETPREFEPRRYHEERGESFHFTSSSLFLVHPVCIKVCKLLIFHAQCELES